MPLLYTDKANKNLCKGAVHMQCLLYALIHCCQCRRVAGALKRCRDAQAFPRACF